MNTELGYFACLDFTNGVAYGGTGAASIGSITGSITISDYTTLPSFDDVQFYFCGDGTQTFRCSFWSTYISFRETIPTNMEADLWGINRNLSFEICLIFKSNSQICL